MARGGKATRATKGRLLSSMPFMVWIVDSVRLKVKIRGVRFAMTRCQTSSFILEIGLVVDSKSDAELLSRFQAGRQLYNACLSEAIKRMRRLRDSAEYKAAKHLPLKTKQRSLAFISARAQYQFTDYDLQAFGTLTAKASVWIAQKIDSNSVQTLATRAFKAAERVLFGKAKKVRFKVPNRFNSIENKTNKQGLRWKDNCLVWGKLKLPTLIDWENPVHLHGLNQKIKYCRLLARELNGKRRWFVQIVLEGSPYHKPNHQVGNGLIGLDLNVQAARDSYYGSESILTAAWQVYQFSKRVGESESPQSQSSVERMAVKLGTVDQIASCGRQVNSKS